MRRSFVLFLAVGVGVVLGRMFDGVSSTAEAGGGEGGGEPTCASENGDVNADGSVDIADAITVLGNLFLGCPTALVPLCDPPELVARIAELEAQLKTCQDGLCGTCPTRRTGTGQTLCYDQDGIEIPCDSEICAGQDGLYQTGCSSEGRYTDNGDGTVTDNCTGLMWQTGPGVGLSWCDALAYCESLDVGEYEDWRLPNARELQSLLDFGRSQPAIDPAFGALSSDYWSSTSWLENPDWAWFVSFNFGGVAVFFDNNRTGEKESIHLVRAVRGGP